MPGFPAFTRNSPSPAPGNSPATAGASGFQRIPRMGGATPEQQSAVYNEFYGNMPMPATQYATSVTSLSSLDIVPGVRTIASNASVVDRHLRRDGLVYTAGRQSRKSLTPQQNKPVTSSNFEKWLLGPQVNYITNNDWYIAYPAATVMFGGDHNLALSTRVDQLTTRTTGGPGPSAMGAAPRFSRVQQVPRYSTIPPMYPTQSTQG
jgi:hypothetical protein